MLTRICSPSKNEARESNLVRCLLFCVRALNKDLEISSFLFISNGSSLLASSIPSRSTARKTLRRKKAQETMMETQKVRAMIGYPLSTKSYISIVHPSFVII